MSVWAGVLASMRTGWLMGGGTSLFGQCRAEAGWSCYAVMAPARLLVEFLDPQYETGLDDGQDDSAGRVSPDWVKVQALRERLVEGSFDHGVAERSDGAVHLLASAAGAVVENGNHRVLAAALDAGGDFEGAMLLPVHVTVAPGGEVHVSAILTGIDTLYLVG